MKSIIQKLTLAAISKFPLNQVAQACSSTVYTYAIVDSQIRNIAITSETTSMHNLIAVSGVPQAAALKLSNQLQAHFKALSIALPRCGISVNISPNTNQIECRSVCLAILIRFVKMNLPAAQRPPGN